MTVPNWFLDELAHAGSEHLDANYVPGYDRKAGTDPAEDLAALQALGLNNTHTLIDFGAGTGTFALAAAAVCRRVIAVDVSLVMLAALRAKAAGQGVTNVEAVRSGFVSYEHQGELADFVYSRHALHHLPDFWKVLALQRIADVIKTGGVFYLRDLVYSFEPSEMERQIEAWVSLGKATPELGWTRAELETHVREEYSPFSWLLEPMLEHTGFRIEQVQRAGAIYAAYTCRKV